jgi:hypothetical protein
LFLCPARGVWFRTNREVPPDTARVVTFRDL